jgi:GxxExxY protein
MDPADPQISQIPQIPTLGPNGDSRTYSIIGAAQKVHRVLGPGFLERVYQEALALELGDRAIAFEEQVELRIQYCGRWLAATYRADFFACGSVIVEIKAAAGLTTVDDAQLLNYLKASGVRTGLLLNFGASSLEQRRMVWGPPDQTSSVQSV